MINLIKSPQRADIKVSYDINGDILTVNFGEAIETFDFTGITEGRAEEIIAETLPINPIISVEKIGTDINITVIRFYGEDEKSLFEEVQ